MADLMYLALIAVAFWLFARYVGAADRL